MLTRYKVVLFVLMSLVAGLLLLLLSLSTQTATAQESPATLRALLESLKAQSQADSPLTFSVEFAVPLVSGERTWLMPDTQRKRSIGDIGEDYICFSEPWNDDTRNRCTPFTNIVSVTFTR